MLPSIQQVPPPKKSMSLSLPDLAQDQFYDHDLFYQSEVAQPTYDWSLPFEQTVAPTDVFNEHSPDVFNEHSPDVFNEVSNKSTSDEDGKDISSKERRQIRNKISARNFRMRRKEYIVNLEAEIKKYKTENRIVRKELMESRKENARILNLVDGLREGLEKVALIDSTLPRWVPESSFKLDACARKERLDALLKRFSTDQKKPASSSNANIPSRLATGSPVKQEDSSFTVTQRVKVHSVRIPSPCVQIFSEKKRKDLSILQFPKKGVKDADVLVKILFVVSQCFPKVEFRMSKEQCFE